ncbi:hypothetical protein [Streptomyces sp. NPDC090798]|uniref:hypothetical protein n=1 Tax=Streptomyces sp. NPDC090798 TaxID=3365968 RepID=UPI0038237FF9
MHLILAGLPVRYPRMRVLASHLGGALPLLRRRRPSGRTASSSARTSPTRTGGVFLRAVDHIADSGLTPEEATMILDTNAADLLGLSAP